MLFNAPGLNFVEAGARAQAFSDEPIRAELLSAERMEAHAQSLAAAQRVSAGRGGSRELSARSRDNARVLRECYAATAQTAREKRTITPAAEWLLDNFHIVEDALRQLERELTPRYCHSLPPLADGALAGLPRAYGVAWAIVAHSDSRFDAQILRRFLVAYQRADALTLREIWAVPLMLGCVLIENLRRMAAQVVSSQVGRREADALADTLLAAGSEAGAAADAALNALPHGKLSRAFTVQLVQRLRYRDIPGQRLDERLSALGLDADALVQSEHAVQAAANLTVRNIITSLRAMGAFDWQSWFEEVSAVDAELRANAAFRGMDFATRDRYRHALEELALGSQRAELDIARAVIERSARAQADAQRDAREADPGYYLISTGRLAFEREIGFRPSLRQKILRTQIAHAPTAYFGCVAVLALAILAPLLALSIEAGVAAGPAILLALFGLFPAYDIAVVLVNRLVTSLIGPRHLPRLQLAQGVPAELRTVVAMPIMLTSEAAIAEQAGQLEAHYLANPGGEVTFALLSDWTDADLAKRADDERMLEAAIEAIATLNARHGPDPAGAERFHLFHRARRWSESEQKWIGWERKRGKLHEFNRLLREAQDTTYIALRGRALQVPQNVRYVITLDADTRLPIDTVRRLVGTAAHPLNKPRLDARTRRVVEGYALLQPRITPTLAGSRESSVFQRIFSGASGIDPYAGAVSDVYQDLFGEGNFAGKGLYDLDAFENALEARVPEATILSHDLFEGLFARCGLISDIDVFEEFPSHIEVAASRLHRWMRGDWQLLPWIIGRRARGVPALGRWKMFDNLRRSLSAPAALGVLLTSWTAAFAPQPLWLAFVLLTLAFPALVSICSGLVPSDHGVSRKHHFRAVADDLLVGSGHAVVALTLLAHNAWLSLDAIVRTLYRLAFSRRHLLEWVTAAQAKNLAGLAFANFLWPLRGASAVATGATALLLWLDPAGLGFAAPFIVLWWGSPIVARIISLPPRTHGGLRLARDTERLLRLAGRRIWLFFETFVGAEDHWLPPDNFQETPQPVLAHRSSPTNFGLYLLSILAARDFGWTGLTDTVERLDATMQTLRGLARYRGHFYNWYDTRALRALEPAYISSVDSGNLAADLLVLAQACEELAGQPLFRAVDLRGIEDTAALLRSALYQVSDDARNQTVSLRELNETLAEIEAKLGEEPPAWAQWEARWRALAASSATLLDIARTLAQERGAGGFAEILAWSGALHADVTGHERDLEQLSVAQGADAPVAIVRSKALGERLRVIGAQARELVAQMDFSFLFDTERRLFSIGLRVADATLDPSYYDLLASEARVTSFLAIAKGDVPATHWFRLGRALTPVGPGAVLLSWSGSMFEYLMPSLIMYTPRNSLLDQSCRLAVQRQIEYGRERATPWGVSESAYNVRDRAYTYQYCAFGVPGLGLKRGLADDLVIAPYATMLAAMYEPAAAAANLLALEAAGARGRYGCYESIDYTSTRRSEDGAPAVVRAWFAHHQGMSLAALANVVHDGIMRHRFHREPMVRASELLLQERTPREIPARGMPAQAIHATQVEMPVEGVSRRFHSARSPIPATHLLSNGRYSVMITAAGSGYSRWKDLALTRWREDPTCDPWGSYIFLREPATGAVWSATQQPAGGAPDAYEAVFLEDRARISRRDDSLSSVLEILVSPEDDAEIRRLALTNEGSREREIEITSYAEVVLAPQAADVAHPAFSNLFVKTEYLAQERALLAVRRPRRADAAWIWAAHVLAGESLGAVEYETDRARLLGRGRSLRNPVAVADGCPLSNTVGPVLDPVFSLRTRVTLPPGKTVRVMFSTMVATSREDIVGLADKYHEPATYERSSTLAWTHAQVQLHHFGIDAAEANLFQHLANRILFLDPHLRPPAEVMRRNALGPRALWRHRISGDRPVVLLRIEDTDGRAIVRQMLRAHEYWRAKGLQADLVILNERKASYIQDLQESLEAMVRSGRGAAEEAAQGAVFVLRADLLTNEESDLLQTVARITLNARQGTLAEQVARMRRGSHAEKPPRLPKAAASAEDEVVPATPRLEFFNGLGGFAQDAAEYVTVLNAGQRTPAPWINVVANPQLGFLVSESGCGYTWAGNSRENQLTPWSNDPVGDPPGEALYLRDEESGELWGPTALPVRIESARYVARHGQGYSRFAHGSHGIACDLVQFVAWDDPIKISHLTLENRSGRTRRISLTAYIEWVLGFSRAASAPFVVSSIDSATGAMFAQNAWNSEFGRRVAFADLCGEQQAWTADRTEFIGRNGSLAAPAALAAGVALSKRAEAGVDPCCALQTSFELKPGERHTITLMLGQAADADVARELVQRYRARDALECLKQVTREWDELLGRVQIRTPERAMDLLFNRWLLYQALACRMWARTAFYQAGGAYGFRDQLQDSMAFATVRPELARAQLVRAAARQFAEGDVQHWWHPPSGRGVRTHCSDDLIWLPYAAAHYIAVTGDYAVLDEESAFLEGPPLAPGEDEAYFEPAQSAHSATLFEHCARALDRSLRTGAHGLPLIGSCDWNDGMNRVGHEGRGESVWLAWFLYDTLMRFAPLAERRGDTQRANAWRAHAAALQGAVERDSWDGAWYRRAYFDDGTPLGTAAASECRIDSLAQSWAAISGAADPARARRAMQSVDEYLVRRGDELVLLFTPPFDRTPLDPGYIKGYLPGLRENGGQYTHAAVWCVVAWAALGDGDRAGQLLELLNPINHAATRTGVHAYKVEPYVVAADVYGEPPQVRRGGWTWYTGAAGWLYRAGTEWLLGLRRRGETLEIDPCIPRHWRGFEVRVRHGASLYEIRVDNSAGVCRGVAAVALDGKPLARASVPLVDDAQPHLVQVTLGPASR